MKDSTRILIDDNDAHRSMRRIADPSIAVPREFWRLYRSDNSIRAMRAYRLRNARALFGRGVAAEIVRRFENPAGPEIVLHIGMAEQRSMRRSFLREQVA